MVRRLSLEIPQGKITPITLDRIRNTEGVETATVAHITEGVGNRITRNERIILIRGSFNPAEIYSQICSIHSPIKKTFLEYFERKN